MSAFRPFSIVLKADISLPQVKVGVDLALAAYTLQRPVAIYLLDDAVTIYQVFTKPLPFFKTFQPLLVDTLSGANEVEQNQPLPLAFYCQTPQDSTIKGFPKEISMLPSNEFDARIRNCDAFYW